MEFFSRVWENIENRIFVDEFLHEYRNPIVKVIFIIYCVSGGFCFDSHVRSSFRKSWIGFYIGNIITVYVSCLFYFFNAPIQDYYASLLPAPIMSGVLGKFGLFVWIFFMKDTFVTLFAFLNRKNRTSKPDIDPERCVSEANMENYSAFDAPADSNKYKTIFTTAFCFNLIIMSSASAINSEEYVKIDNYINYVYPVYAPYNQTYLVRITIRLFQSITMMPEIAVFATFYTLIFVIAFEIYDSFLRLAVFLRDASQSLVQTIEEISVLETAMRQKRIPSSLSKIQELKIKRKLAVDEFQTKFLVVIKQHQQLISTAILFKDKIQPIFAIIYLEIYFLLTMFEFFLFSITDTKQFFYALPLIGIFLATLSIWLLFSFIGEMFARMNELIAWEVYNSPWYLLEPKDRRIIHTFLTMLQKPITIVIFKIYPVNLPFIPQLLNSTYSQMQVLRTLQFKKQKRRN